MTGGQIVALIFAILLLLPGGCFLYGAIAGHGVFWLFLPIAAIILALAAWLFRIALHRFFSPPRS
jgi:hypothetical protein